MLRALSDCLNKSGYLENEKMSTFSARGNKQQLICPSLSIHNAAEFCRNAGDVVAHNLLYAVSQDSPILTLKMAETIASISKLVEKGDVLSSIALSLLVHASDCTTQNQFTRFALFVLKLSHDSYRMALDAERPPKPTVERSIGILSSPSLSNCLVSGLDKVTAADIPNISVEFVFLRDSGMKGWCAPSMVVLNVFALQTSMHLKHYIPLAVLIGREKRQVLEAKQAGDNFNFFTPEKSPRSLERIRKGHYESGFYFERAAFGEKYNFPDEPDPVAPQAIRLIEAIEAGLGQGQCPALTENQRAEFFGLNRWIQFYRLA